MTHSRPFPDDWAVFAEPPCPVPGASLAVATPGVPWLHGQEVNTWGAEKRARVMELWWLSRHLISVTVAGLRLPPEAETLRLRGPDLPACFLEPDPARFLGKFCLLKINRCPELKYSALLAGGASLCKAAE